MTSIFTQIRYWHKACHFSFWYASKMKQVFSIIDPFQIYIFDLTHISFVLIWFSKERKCISSYFFSLSVYGKEWQNCFIPRYDDLFVNGRILVNVCAYLCVSLWTCLSICMCWEINVFYCDLDLFPPHKIKEVIRRRFDCLKIEKFFFLEIVQCHYSDVEHCTHHYNVNHSHKIIRMIF